MSARKSVMLRKKKNKSKPMKLLSAQRPTTVDK